MEMSLVRLWQEYKSMLERSSRKDAVFAMKYGDVCVVPILRVPAPKSPKNIPSEVISMRLSLGDPQPAMGDPRPGTHHSSLIGCDGRRSLWD